VRQELRLVCRHVDVDRTFPLASFAGKAQIQRVLYISILPSAIEGIALQHLEEQVRAAARRVRLFARGAIARTHRPAVVAAAIADADTADRAEREAAVIPRKAELRRRLWRMVVGAEPQILIDAVRRDDLAGIHPAVGVPDALEFAERLDQFRSEHLRQELCLRLPVPMLA